MKKLHIKRLYALNSQGKLIKASETNKDDSNFFCINCKEKMGIRKGSKRIHHFYHINLECSDETYIHKLSKTILFDRINENKTKSKIFGIGLQKDIINIPYEYTINLFGTEPIKNINDRIDSIVCDNLIDSNIIEIELKNILKKIFDKIKATKDNKLTNIFVKFHKWLIYRIDYYINMKIEYSEESQRKYIFKWQDIKQKWSEIKQKKSLIDNLIFVDEFLNSRRYRFEEIYDDNLHITNYFRKISEKDKNIIINYCYTPKYEYKEKVEYKDISLNFNTIKKVYLDEKKHEGFLADVLTFDDNNIPIFWEIAVSHKCEETKINSNIRIIEILIENNEDIELLSNLDFYGLTVGVYNF